MKSIYSLLGLLIIGLAISPSLCRATPINKATPSDRIFIRQAAYGGNDEIALSKIAVRRSKNPGILKFANRMITQHSQAGAKLEAIATKLGVPVPANVDPAHRKIARNLSKLTGSAFNRAYINIMVKDHTAADHVFQMGTTVNNDHLRSFAVETLPVVEDHLKMATQLQHGASSTMASM